MKPSEIKSMVPTKKVNKICVFQKKATIISICNEDGGIEMRKLHFATSKLVILAVLAMTFSPGYGASIPKHDHALFGTPPDTAIYCGVKATQQMAVSYTLYVSATATGSNGTFQIIGSDRKLIVSKLDPQVAGAVQVNAGTTYSNSYSLAGVLGQNDVVKIIPVGRNIQSMMVSVATGGAAEDPFTESPAQSDNFCVTAPNEPGSASAPALSPTQFSPSGTVSVGPQAPPPPITNPVSTQSLDEAIYCGAVSRLWAWRGVEVERFGVRFYMFWYQQIPYPYTLTVTATTANQPGRFRITFRDRDSMAFELPANTPSTTPYAATHALGGVPSVDDVVKITAEGGITSLTAGVEVPPLPGGFYSWRRSDPYDPFDETQDGAQAQSNNFCVKTGEGGWTSAERYFSRP